MSLLRASSLAELEGSTIDSVIYLQRYAEGWQDGKFEEKFDYRDCIDAPRYRKDPSSSSGGDGGSNVLYTGWFWEYSEMRARDFNCMSLQGSAGIIRDFLVELKAKSVMLDRGETLLHDWFGDDNYWAVRRSMRFAEHLVAVANEFRRAALGGSSDEQDGTLMADKWEDSQVCPRRILNVHIITRHMRSV